MATFTIDVSISSSTAARVTAMAIRYLYLYLSSCWTTGGSRKTDDGRRTTDGFSTASVAPASPSTVATSELISALPSSVVRRPSSISPASVVRAHMHHRRHPRSQRMLRVHAADDGDANRNALHDLREVARGVVRRQQGELGSGCRAHALH